MFKSIVSNLLDRQYYIQLAIENLSTQEARCYTSLELYHIGKEFESEIIVKYEAALGIKIGNDEVLENMISLLDEVA